MAKDRLTDCWVTANGPLVVGDYVQFPSWFLHEFAGKVVGVRGDQIIIDLDTPSAKAGTEWFQSLLPPRMRRRLWRNEKVRAEAVAQQTGLCDYSAIRAGSE